jgi:hypothetical protein
MSRRRAFIVARTNVIVVVCFLLYLMWEWYADPGATWQHWAWILIQVSVFIWVISRIIAKTFAE